MNLIALEPTNRCNRSCRHCLRNPADPPGFLPLETAEAILLQAELLGFTAVALTGGEVALYPHLGDLLRLIAARGFKFTLVTNGFEFPKRVLPLLLVPDVKERAASVCFSLDGARAATHDGLRGPKSFREVFEALLLCREHGIPASLKSVVTALNRGELAELALVGARLGAQEHEFLYPSPTPRLIREGLLPPPEELRATMRWIEADLVGALKAMIKEEDAAAGSVARSGPGQGGAIKYKITITGYSSNGSVLNCPELGDSLYVDYQGNLIFCCSLSHVTLGDGVPTSPGWEVVADLKEVSLEEAINLKKGLVRQFRQAAEVTGGLSETPCHWCLNYFGKLEWLKDFPDSPWAAGVCGDA